MYIVLIVASLGRPEQIEFLLDRISQQSRKPDKIILSVESVNDLPKSSHEAEVVFGKRGASVQRNRAIDGIIDDCDVIVFLDDDYVPSSQFFANVETFFSSNSDVAGMTGSVLADGVSIGGLSTSHALDLLRRHDMARSEPYIQDVNHVYGCNMVFRSRLISNLRFDENLPLNSWQEDVDFAARTLEYGRVVKTNAIWGVHLGVIKSRTSGVRFGYSQIINPVYLLKKGTMTAKHAFRIMLKNLIVNHLRSFLPENYIDRRGRLRGNWLALRDLMIGHADPRRVLDIS